jgi:pimeloyl-ACP methyl ester carboxylesterase
MGGDPQGALLASYALADPARLTPAVPVVLLHGTQDETVPPEVSRSYAQRMQDGPGHAAVRLVMVPDCEHFGLIDPDHPAFATVLATVRTLAA